MLGFGSRLPGGECVPFGSVECFCNEGVFREGEPG